MSLLKTMIKHTGGGQEVTAGTEPASSLPPQPPQPAVYISTGLDVHEIEDARDWPEDKDIDGTLCRRLSPEYFSWLRSRMVTAQAAHKAGKLPEDAWNTLRQRFNALQELAIREFGKESLQEVLHSFSPKNYRPPALRPELQEKPVEVPRKDWIYPGNQAWKCKQPVTSRAVAKVDAIREEAMAKGYGLVCFVDGDQEIGEVTEHFIEIVHGPKSGRPSTLRFFNPDVPQPWMKKVED
jgi:hypothetical protein